MRKSTKMKLLHLSRFSKRLVHFLKNEVIKNEIKYFNYNNNIIDNFAICGGHVGF